MDAGSRPDRFDIDPLRGLVCLSLCVLHFYVGPLFEEFDALFGEAGRDAVHCYRPGVESFLVLAGLLLAHSLRPVPGERVSVGAYLRRRFLRLVVPYWAAVLLATADRWLPALAGSASPQAAGWREVTARLFFAEEVFGYPEAAVGFWSMVVLEQFYLLWLGAFGLVLLFPGTAHDPWRATRVMAVLTLAGCLASAAWVCHAYRMGEIGAFDGRFRLPRSAVYLTLGMLLYWHVRGGMGRGLLAIAVIAVLGVGIYTDRSQPYKALILAAVLVPLVRGWHWPAVWPVRALGFVGRRSYSLYLMHVIVGNRFLMADAVRSRAGLGDWWAIPELVAAIGVSLLAAMVFYRLVELPMYRRALRVRYRRPEPDLAARADYPDVVQTRRSRARDRDGAPAAPLVSGRSELPPAYE
jgi:peptidoglycan/LPS O-acetylase OafA/YrhL